MQHAFLVVVIAVGAVGVLGALVTLLGTRRTWDAYGRDRLLLESDMPRPRAAERPGADSVAERDAELRQMLGARNARRVRRGQAPLDVDAELARLTGDAEAPAVDAELRDEIRALVIARNHRRARRGDPELDVEAEVARQISELY